MTTLTFEPNLEHQTHATQAVTDLFLGQPMPDTMPDSHASGVLSNTPPNFELTPTIDPDNTHLINQQVMSQTIANRLILSDEQLLANMQAIQARHGLPVSPTLYDDNLLIPEQGLTASIEMETGTGKTYVYLRSIYELHKRYGMTKFVIVVPSVAIREGVIKSIEMTKRHFASLYDNVSINTNGNAMVYDSKHISKLRDFAIADTVQILIMNIDAFAKDENVINQVRERGIAPIEYIQATHPVVIVDEPQNMETEKRLSAINSLNPLITLRYSATHKHVRHLLYRLNPVDAYDAGLVKQIEVDSVMAQDEFNDAYIELIDIIPKKTKITAKVSVYANVKGVVKKKTFSVSVGDDLYAKTGREIYKTGYVVSGISASEGYIEFDNGTVVAVGEQSGGMTDGVMRYQIERTITAHLDKQRKLLPHGIKVLSLLFIDRVDNYLVNTEAGYERAGKFAKWFEQIYSEQINKPKYHELKQQLTHAYPQEVSTIHNGYFSVDKKGRAKDTSGSTKADDDTYSLIMKDKEKLLDITNPLQFIFSHSALKEGWDNPNVFQICTLNETKSTLKKRQEIGRGLRLCVGADGKRIYDKNINRLTVIANESYEDFAKNLQNEIETECGVSFAGRIKNEADKQAVIYRKGFVLDANFQAIWDKIKHQTSYQVDFDQQKLIDTVTQAVQTMETIYPPRIKSHKVGLVMTSDGIDTQTLAENHQHMGDTDSDARSWQLPDVLTYLGKHTKLTRATLLAILKGCDRLSDLLINPQVFLDRLVGIIQQEQARLMVTGVAYHKTGNTYAQSLIEQLANSINEVYESDHHFNVNNASKTIYDNVIPLDSNTENQFAQDCESMEQVQFYFKLPSWFKIPTPVGTYNPDWAVLMQDEEEISQLYFVAETKNTGGKSPSGQAVDISLLPLSQQQKIHCGRAHFKALNNELRFKVVEKVGQLVNP